MGVSPSAFNVDNIVSKDCGGEFVGSFDKKGSWCPADHLGVQKSCGLRAKFKKWDSETESKGWTHKYGFEEKCVEQSKCDIFDTTLKYREYVACPNFQCPAYTYRSGLDNI